MSDLFTSKGKRLSNVKLVTVSMDRWGDEDFTVGVASDLNAAKRLVKTYADENSDSFSLPESIKWEVRVFEYHGKKERYWVSGDAFPHYHISTMPLYT